MTVDTFRVWRLDEVAWGVTSCEAPGCFHTAEVLADFDDGRDVGVPLCLDDADLLLERTVAIAEFPEPRSHLNLPDPWEHARRPQRRPPRRLAEWEVADRTPERWLAEQSGIDTSNPDWDIPW